MKDLIYQFILRKPLTRRYLSPKLSIDRLFKILKERQINYVVLRWWDKLPNVEKGEDLDLLIDDKDLPQILDLFVSFPYRQKFDIYSVSGNPGSDYQGLPYYPPHLAKIILDHRIWFNDLYAVPDEKRFFLSMAYHAIFHKGKNSGLCFPGSDKVEGSDHNYSSEIKSLAKINRVAINTDKYEDVFNYLQSEKWVPELDTFRKLAVNDAWISMLLPKVISDSNVDEGEVAVFIIREYAIRSNKLDLIKNELLKKFDILFEKPLEDEEKASAAKNIRGGKWDKGPFPINGGLPVYILVCFDYHPKPLSKKEKIKYPNVKNKNILLKNSIRDKINFDHLPWEHTNCIHAADDEVESWEYIKFVIPDEQENLKNTVKNIRAKFATHFPIIKTFDSNFTRAKIELIKYKNIEAIKKTFKDGRERFLKRELSFYREFAYRELLLPGLIDFGENYFISQYYRNVLEDLDIFERNKIIKQYAHKIIDALKLFYDEGFAHINFTPKNIIITSKNEFKIIDFEFVYEYKIKPKTFNESYDIIGVPDDFDGDLGLIDPTLNYKKVWEPIIGPLAKYV